MHPQFAIDQFVVASGGGGKGGKGKGGEAPDTLRSEASLLLLMGCGEGEVNDFATVEDLEKAVFLNRTPIRNPDNSRNFSNCRVAFAPGTQTQSELPGFAGRTQSDVDVNQSIRRDQGPAVRYISDPSAEVIRISLALPGLVEQRDNQVLGSSVELLVKITDKTGAILTRDGDDNPGFAQWVIEGKATSQYETKREWSLSLESPYRVEIQRVTADSTDSKKRNDVVWSRYTLINFDRLRHPHTVLLGLDINSRDFSGVPEIGIRHKWLKCALPHNYDPVTRTYTGIFDGRFTGYGWTNNPAYIIREIMTNSRFGTGAEINPLIHNNYTLYRIGKYCDEMVPDAFGGMEPRYTLNGVISSREDADKLLAQLAEHVNLIWYYTNGGIEYLQDAPRPIARVYTESNTLQTVDDNGRITKPCFEHEGTGRKARHTACLVRFRNKENFHQPDTAYYADEAGIERYGYNLKEIDLPLCDSLGQALRAAKAVVLTEKYQTDTVKFRVANEGQLVQPGEIGAIASPTRQPGRQGGRIVEVSENLSQVTLDRPVTLLPGRIYSLLVDCFKQSIPCNLSAVSSAPYLVTGSGFTRVLVRARVGSAVVTEVLSDTQLTLSGNPGLGTGTAVVVDFMVNNLQMTRAVTTPAGTTNKLDLVSPFPAKPPRHGTWLLSDNVQPLDRYQIIAVTKSSRDEYELIGIEDSEQKFAELNQLGDPIEKQRTLVPPKIQDLRVVNYRDELTVGWKVQTIIEDGIEIPNPNNTGYVVRYRTTGDNWTVLPETNFPTAVIFPVRVGYPYSVQVAVRDVSGALHWSDTLQTGAATGRNTLSLELNPFTLIEV